MEEASTNVEKRIGNLFGATGGNHAGMVYDKRCLAPTLSTSGGGYREPIIVMVKRKDEMKKLG